MRILAIDPGPVASGFVLFDGEHTLDAGHIANRELLKRLRERTFGGPGYMTVIEQVESMGMAVGRSVFETVFWSGRFAQAAGRFRRLPRSAIKLHLCQSRKAKDGDIRRALIERFRDTAVLLGISGHKWAALAVAVTYFDQRQGKDDVTHEVVRHGQDRILPGLHHTQN